MQPFQQKNRKKQQHYKQQYLTKFSSQSITFIMSMIIDRYRNFSQEKLDF